MIIKPDIIYWFQHGRTALVLGLTMVILFCASLSPPASLAAACTVTNTSNNVGTVGSLPYCINFANSNPGTTISFNIPDTDGGYTNGGSGTDYWWQISIGGTALPALTADGTIIDGSTQRGNYGSDTNTLGPEIEIRGPGSTSIKGLEIQSNSNSINELVVNNFSGTGVGIYINGGASNTIKACYLGLDPKGSALGNAQGIQLANAANNNIIGGTTASERNVISGNTNRGIDFLHAGTSNNKVWGNYIGTNTTATAVIKNVWGIYLNTGTDTNFIGGTTDDKRNVIAGNDFSQIFVASDGNTIEGNYIGTKADGTPLASAFGIYGQIHVMNAADAAIGNMIQRNLIRGSLGDGVTVSTNASDTRIYNNTIDGNTNDGIQVDSGIAGTRIRNNVISYNGAYGVNDSGTGTVISHNDFYSNTTNPCNSSCTPGNNNLTDDPLFNSRATGDFSLQGSSTLINAACDLGAAGDDTTCDDATDSAQPDLNGVGPGNYNDSAPSMGSFEPAAAVSTTIGDGTAPSNQTTPIHSTNNAVDAFTLSTDSGSDTLTALTVTRTGGADADVATGGVKLWRDDGGTPDAWDATDTQIGSGASLSSGTASFSSLSESINTSATQYLITYDIAPGATGGNTLQAAVTAATVSNTLVNNDNVDATLTVGNCQVVNTNANGDGSLDSCFTFANSNPGTTISFNIPTSDANYQPDPGDGNRWWEITPSAVLPTLSVNGTIIDGTTQTTNQGDTNAAGPEIIIIGSGVGANHGIIITGNNSTVKGLTLNDFDGGGTTAAIITNGDNNTFTGNYIGTNYKGTNTPAVFSNERGIVITTGGQSNTIGGTTAAERNIISNNGYGVIIQGNGTTLNTVKGNYIGPDSTGNSAVGNTNSAVLIELGAQSNTIGGSGADDGNVISGNPNTGVQIKNGDANSSDSNIIRGNLIGIGADGSTDLGNGLYGVYVAQGDGNIIGGTGANDHNVIAKNSDYGIVIFAGALNTVVQGNYIGVLSDGTTDKGNSNHGILVSGSSGSVSGTVIGGTNAGEANIIAYNNGDGIHISPSGNSATDNDISGNSIFGNTGLGINLAAGANNDQAAPVIYAMAPNASDFDVTASLTTGDTIEFFRVDNPAAPAVSADSSGAGEGYLYLGSCTDGGGACSGPYITGTDGAADGTVTATLTSGGLSAGDLVTATTTDATNGTSEFGPNMVTPSVLTCQVSTTADAVTPPDGSLRACFNYAIANAGTTISFNIPTTDSGYQTSGVDNWWKISAIGCLPAITANGTIIDATTQTTNKGDTNSLGPEIELDGSGAPGCNGIYMSSTNGQVKGFIINGFEPAGGGGGVTLNPGSGNTVTGNYLGTNYAGTSALPNGFGIVIAGSTSNTIGGTTAAERNLISGNNYDGIYIYSNADSNVIKGNYVGTNPSGTGAVANSRYGIRVDGDGTNTLNSTTIGGSAAGEGNLISGNSVDGILLYDNVDGTIIKGNKIGTQVNGIDDLGNGGYGIFIYGDTNGGVNNTVVGGTAAGEANVIAYNGSPTYPTRGGIATGTTGPATTNNKFSGNSIFSSDAKGITLGAGSNGNKTAPTIPSISPNGSDFDVTVSTTSGDTVEFFRANNSASPAVTPDAAGEGYLFLGSCTDGGGACSGPYISGSDGAADGSMTVTLTSSGLSGGDEVSATATDGTNGTSEFATNTTAPAGASISGKVFEDANFAGTAAEYENETNDKALANVDVELYDNSDVYQDSTTTDANGDFSFSGLADGTYKVRVRSATIADSDTTPKGGLNGTVPATWPYPLPEMTWGNGAAVYGGQSATADDTDTGDNAGPGDTWVSVTVSGANVTDVNFGFAYNLIVNVADDGNADNTLSDQGSLRQFIKNANAIGSAGSTTANYSQFRMQVATNQTDGADNWWRISPVAALPTLSDGGTTLDGARQRLNTASDDNSRGPEIEINGASAGADTRGLEINNATNVTVQDLTINQFTSSGIYVDGDSAAQIYLYKNYVGTDAIGESDLGNNSYGIEIYKGTDIDIGDSSKGNLVSGNNSGGIYTWGLPSTIRIRGNKVGTNAAGTLAIGNTNVGITASCPNVTIGGPNAGEGNIIAGSSGFGLAVAAGDNVTIQGNTIGSGVNRTENLGNTSDGIIDYSGSGTNINIGGLNENEGNFIAHNGGNGIQILAVGGSEVYGNTIFDNTLGGLRSMESSAVIAKNLIYNNGGGANDGVFLLAGANNNKLYHNTIHGNGRHGVSVAAGVTGATVQNNIITGSGAYGIDAAAALTNDHNLFNGNTSGTCNGCTLGSGSLIAAPQYVDDAGGDFSLTECSSPAINTGADLAGDQPDMNGAAAGLFNGPAPDRGALESSCVTSPPDIAIDGDFSDWCNGSGVEICIDDQGGADDWTSPNRLDITRFGVATNQVDTFYVLFGFDDTSLSQPATACAMMDTDSPPNDNVDRVLCAVIDGASSSVSSVDLYTCDDSISGGCGSASLSKTYAVSEYNSSNSETGPFGGTDTFVEVAMPFADLGLGGDTVVLTSLISFPGGSFLKSPKDSIFGDTEQNYDDRVIIDTETGGGGTVGAPGTPVIAGNVFIDEGSVVIGAGKTVHLLVGGSSVGTDTTDDFGGYFFSTAVSAGQSLLAYIDNDGSYQGTSVSVSDGGNLTDFDIYASHLITRHDNGAALSNVLLDSAKGGSGDTDILYTVSGSDLTVTGTGTELYLPSSHSFSPAGAVTTDHLKSLGTFSGGSAAIDINGTLTIAGGTFTATSATTSVSGNFALSGGSFAHNAGTVTLDGTSQSIAGSPTFKHLTKTVASADTLTFTAGATTTVEGTCTLQGADSNLLSLRSSSDGTRWNLTLPAGAAKAISYVDVKDSDASGSDSSLLVVNPANSASSDNNLSWFLPLLTITKTASSGTANPGAVITYTVLVSNTGAGEATDVILDDHLSPYTAWSLDAFGASTPFEFTDGAPSSALTLGTASYSDDAGGTYTYTPTSTGGGAPAGYDGNVTNWKIPMTGTMDSGGSFTLKYKVMVE